MAQRKPARAKTGPSSQKKKAQSSEEVERYGKAVEAFGRALKNLHKGDLDRARGQFQSILSEFPDERELVERVRVYVAICDRTARRETTATPRDFEEYVTSGVFSHNLGDYANAAKHLRRALELQPKSDYAHYCLAAVYARMGDSPAALRHLREAMMGNRYSRVLAQSDSDFEPLRASSEASDLFGSS
jgi:tetratricopeptide (TPR) repeat protein